MKKSLKLSALLLLFAAMVITACSGKQPVNTPVIVTQSSSITIGESDVPDESSFNADPGSEPVSEPRKKSNDIVILATSDVHCSPEKGFGYAGLYRIPHGRDHCHTF